MEKWIIPANRNLYDISAAFEAYGFADWSHTVHFHTGDLVYIYCSKPDQKVMYQTVVEKMPLSPAEVTNDREFWKNKKDYERSLNKTFSRLRLLSQADCPALSLEHLKARGLNNAPQASRKIGDILSDYVELVFEAADPKPPFPEAALPEHSFEGAVKTVSVNRYERNAAARQSCIAVHGCRCAVCGMDFEEVCGELGKGFIHVHHIVPLNKIGKEYHVDPAKDLIPICPNCHAMLHRNGNGKAFSPEELKALLASRRKP